MSFESFEAAECKATLDRDFRQGRLRETSVDEVTKAAMIAQALTENPLQGTYVEIGPACYPYFPDSARPFNLEDPEVRYVGIDGGRSTYVGDQESFPTEGWTQYGTLSADNYMKQAADKIAGSATAEAATLLWGDALALPFRDASSTAELPVREIFMRDVIHAAGIHPKSTQVICEEAARVLNDHGLLIICETEFYGYYQWPRGVDENTRAEPYLRMLESLDKTGFRKRVLVHAAKQPELVTRFMKQFPGGYNNSSQLPSGYFLVCQKGEEGVITPDRLGQKLRRMLGSLVSHERK